MLKDPQILAELETTICLESNLRDLMPNGWSTFHCTIIPDNRECMANVAKKKG